MRLAKIGTWFLFLAATFTKEGLHLLKRAYRAMPLCTALPSLVQPWLFIDVVKSRGLGTTGQVLDVRNARCGNGRTERRHKEMKLTNFQTAL